jgi:hypothetical protein
MALPPRRGAFRRVLSDLTGKLLLIFRNADWARDLIAIAEPVGSKIFASTAYIGSRNAELCNSN